MITNVYCTKKAYASEAEARRHITRMTRAPSDPRRRQQAADFKREPVKCKCGMWHIFFPERQGHQSTRTRTVQPVSV